jgi:hypothetical protein
MMEEMMTSHPRAVERDTTRMPGIDAVRQCIESCLDCEAACGICADACLAEEDVAELTRCIRADLDCADICAATARVLTRLTDAEWRVWHAQLASCRVACATCAEVCEQHAAQHEHCRICAETCRSCFEVCNNVLEGRPAA